MYDLVIFIYEILSTIYLLILFIMPLLMEDSMFIHSIITMIRYNDPQPFILSIII